MRWGCALLIIGVVALLALLVVIVVVLRLGHG